MAVVNRPRLALGKAPRSCGHYGEWLHYAYLQRGRIEDARAVLNRCREEVDQDRSTVNSFAQMRTDFLINTQLWGDAAATWRFPELADHIAALAGAPGRAVAAAGLEASRESISGSTAAEVPAAAKAAHH
jgi:hypothetical protein